MPEPKLYTLRGPGGDTIVVPEDHLAAAVAKDYHLENEAEAAGRLSSAAKDEQYGGVRGTIGAVGAAGLRGLSAGTSDVIISALGGGDELRNLREAHPELSTAVEVGTGVGAALASGGAGALGKAAGGTFAGKIAQTGASIARVEEGASAGRALVAGIKGGAFEGGAFGLGQGVTELALSDKPLDVEHIASTLGSHALFGTVTGGAVGGAAKGLEHGLSKARTALDDFSARAARQAEAPAGIADDLVGMDRKGLAAARKTEIEAIEQARVPQRAAAAEDLAAFRQELKESKVWLAAKDSEIAELKTVGKRLFKADKALDNLLDDPKALAASPQAALRHLRVQESALEAVARKADDLRLKFAADTSGTRAAALDALPGTLERNRALQKTIGDLAATPSSARLAAIEDAKEALTMGAAKADKGLAQRLAEGSAFSAGAGLASMIPGVSAIPGASAFAGAKAAELVGRLFGAGGKIGEAAAAGAQRASKAVGAFLDVANKVAPSTPVLATKVLEAVRFGPGDDRDAKPPKRPPPSGPGKKPPKDGASSARLAELYKQRSEELRSQVAAGPDGRPVMHMAARQEVARRLAPIAAANPVLADQLETIAARRIEHIADKQPRRPDLAGIQAGPDIWQPDDMAMRSWARTIAAVEDPHGVIERLVHGSVTPEDADAMRTVYPEMMADVTRQIIEQLPTLQKSLPYERRIALSIFTGVPVDPAMDPDVLAILQGSFALEEGSDGGMQAPAPAPQFGSVRSAEKATPAQERMT